MRVDVDFPAPHMMYLRHGWKTFARDQGFSEGHVLQFKLMESGLLSVSRPGQEILERTACQMNPANGDLVLRFEVGFPANGRTVNARELAKIFFDFLPDCVSHSLMYAAVDAKAVARVTDLAEDQQYIRDHLD